MEARKGIATGPRHTGRTWWIWGLTQGAGNPKHDRDESLALQHSFVPRLCQAGPGHRGLWGRPSLVKPLVEI